MKYATNDPTSFKNACKKIKLLLFDCDGVLTDGRIALGNNQSEMKFFSATDGMGIMLWNHAGLMAGAITGRKSEALKKRAAELKFAELHQGISDKKSVYCKILEKRNLKPEQTAYIGDDLNDLKVGMSCGIFFVPANHNRSIRPYADFVLEKNGGHGAVREAIDIILEKKDILDEIIGDFTR